MSSNTIFQWHKQLKHTLGLRSSYRPLVTAPGCTSNTDRSTVQSIKTAMISVFFYVVHGKYRTAKHRNWEWVGMAKWNGPFRLDRSIRESGPPCAVADYGHDVPSTPDGMYTVLAVDKQIEFGWKYWHRLELSEALEPRLPEVIPDSVAWSG